MRTVSMIVLSFIMFILHIVLGPAIEIFTAKIDFIMISILMIAFFTQKWYPPLICAVYSGLAVDITTQALTYVNTGIYLFFGLAMGLFAMFFRNNTVAISGISAFACVAFKHLIFVFLLYIMRLSQNLTFGTFLYGLPSALYTGVIALPLFFFYKWIFLLPFMKEKTEDDGKYIL